MVGHEEPTNDVHKCEDSPRGAAAVIVSAWLLISVRLSGEQVVLPTRIAPALHDSRRVCRSVMDG